VIEWGDGIYGCEAAARHWYGKSAAAVSPVEAAGLAAMIPSPRRLNPQRSAARHARASRRVLWLMTLAGYLGRDAAGLGAEPPPETAPDDGEEEAEAAPGADAAVRPDAPSSVPDGSPVPGPAASPAVDPADRAEPAGGTPAATPPPEPPP
jgi:monofunctional biosynthetic peptidoglycan transglycosylase